MVPTRRAVRFGHVQCGRCPNSAVEKVQIRRLAQTAVGVLFCDTGDHPGRPPNIVMVLVVAMQRWAESLVPDL